MKKIFFLSLLVATLFCTGSFAVETAELIEPLQCFKPYLGSWEGTFSGEGAPPATVKDVVSYTVALDGRAVESRHVVAGAYKGITLYYWDPVEERIKLLYVTNDGSSSTGWVEVSDTGLAFFADHRGGAVSAWKAESVVFSEKSFTSTSEYFSNGKWTQGHAATYLRAE
jgi:hypothetical protein